MAKISINLATGGLQKEEMIVGIDLGTTNSLVAIIHPDTKKPIALKEIDGLSLVPSVVHFDEYNEPQVGTKAVEQLAQQPERTIYSAKRLMGKSYADVAQHSAQLAYTIHDDGTDSLAKVQIGNQFFTPIELSSFILKELKKRAEHILKTPITKAVITVPAYFNDVQRQATRDAGKLAGLDVLRIINEPTAASLAYGLGTQQDQQTIAVYDLGGGTFDISILQIDNGVFDVLATHGNTYLGGDDFDRALVDFWMSKYQLTATEKSEIQELRLAAEKAKKALSENDNFTIEYKGQQLEISINEFNDIIDSIVEQTMMSCAQAMKDAGLTIDQIDSVVMVGGSTRVPLVLQKVKSFFNKEPYTSLNPDEVVALGAAVQADILSGKNTDFLLLDVTPLSLGIETMGGLMDVLIPRNSKIPTKAGRQYTTHVDGQGSMRISVYQGERDLVADNRKLAEFNLKDIPGMPAGLPKVEVTFLLDADGILKVTATELRSGVAQSVDVKPQYGLTDDDVEQMLLASLENAQQDIKTRALVEATTEAEQMLATVDRFIEKHRENLTQQEIEATQQQVELLKRAIASQQKDAIQLETENLNEITRPFAERVMELALKQAMKGQKI